MNALFEIVRIFLRKSERSDKQEDGDCKVLIEPHGLSSLGVNCVGNERRWHLRAFDQQIEHECHLAEQHRLQITEQRVVILSEKQRGEAKHDPAKAVELAKRAANLPGGNNPIVYRTLAAALAENGQFDDAIRAAEHAQELSQRTANSAVADEMTRWVVLFKQGRTLRQARSGH